MITVVVGKEIEKIKGDFKSVINGMNMVGEIPYNVYSELFDVGADCIQKAYELGKAELEEENAELKEKLDFISKNAELAGKALVDMVKREVEKAEQGKVAELKENLAYAKAVMRELLYNSSEYARQMAMDFLEAN